MTCHVCHVPARTAEVKVTSTSTSRFKPRFKPNNLYNHLFPLPITNLNGSTTQRLNGSTTQRLNDSTAQKPLVNHPADTGPDGPLGEDVACRFAHGVLDAVDVFVAAYFGAGKGVWMWRRGGG
ncbi:hypothetical protein MBM_08637 [Drepanopeziza brunnea f. sp. 'multigermtubi' MB_m1]|uniref:Uncharacterized protein n=1 Tax=Marssonina brunnea f. sp. multigermtubi (strain MB_m1) TaxID=1072389 RepID=K1XL77_MARBU|nr:uncharacterized protein MBM_08637 [Drepanopeziza brunnea f. sp. 'multigermtubi' MB_m1]EKD13194.1 hypothetical protein MBM_08637 [Drepanopeziza brunnea f. sp. 'multigermtubi' MB_m1]